MQSLKLTGRTEPEPVDPDEDSTADVYDMFEMVRVVCPDCAQSIGLPDEEDVLPQHARCLTPWNPFVLTVCAGTGRRVTDALPANEFLELQEQETGLLLTLPQGLDWRMQPFSHAGGPGSRPLRVPRLRHEAA
ncbi:hypothetical protein [Streptomyces sp. NPDC049916]|uniref:hypothetical protein n=1 Tax=Streptomyces sp. NPDC049916 TaxID=3155156 RepID=UPI00341AA42E